MPIENKSENIPVRVTPSQWKAFRRAAEAEGLRVSAWLRGLAVDAVQQRQQDRQRAA